MPLFRVTKGQDAFVNYVTIIEAKDRAEAVVIASSLEYRNGDNWVPTGGVDEFDHAEIFEDSVVPYSGESLEEALAHLKREEAPLKLYKISYADQDGESRDLLTYAATPGGAFELWGDYFFEDDWINHRNDCLTTAGIDGILVEDDKGEDNDLRIFEVAAHTGLPRALKWHTDDLKVVAWVEQS